MLISEAMNRSVITIEPDATVEEAVSLVARSGSEHLLVLDEHTLVGIVCECDLRGALAGERVSDRMTIPVMTVRPDTCVEDVAATIAECGVGCVPVTLGGLILGTASEEDLERCGLPVAHAHRHRHARGRRVPHGPR
jgi:acetoin utilization protein AcuB